MTAQTVHFRTLRFRASVDNETVGPKSFEKACRDIEGAFAAMVEQIGKPLSDIDKLVQAEMIDNARKTCLRGGFSFNVHNNEDPDWKLRELSAMERDDDTNQVVGMLCLNPVKWVFDDFLYCPNYAGSATLRVGVTEAMAFARQARARKLLQALFIGSGWPQEKVREFIRDRVSMTITKDDPRHNKFVKFLDDEK